MAVIVCPSCTGQLQVPDVAVPTPGQCPRCLAKFLIPPSSPAAATSMVPAPTAPGGYVTAPTAKPAPSSTNLKAPGKKKEAPPMPAVFAFALAVLSWCVVSSVLSIIFGIYLIATAEPPHEEPEVERRVNVTEVGNDVVRFPRTKVEERSPSKLKAFQLGKIIAIILLVLIRGAMTALATWVVLGLLRRDDRALVWAKVLAVVSALAALRNLALALGMQKVTNLEAYIAWADFIACLATGSLLILLALPSVKHFYSYTGYVPNADQARKVYGFSLAGLLVAMFLLNPNLFKLMGAGQEDGQPIAQGGPTAPAEDGNPQRPPNMQENLRRPTASNPAGGGSRPERPRTPAGQLPPGARASEDTPPPPLEIPVPENPPPLPAGLQEKIDDRIVKMQGLIAYYAFEEESGEIVYDASPFRNQGTGHDIIRGTGKRGRGIRLDGSHIEIPHRELFNLNGENGVAIALWCRPEKREGALVAMRSSLSSGSAAIPGREDSLVKLGFGFAHSLTATMRPSRVSGFPLEVRGELGLAAARAQEGRWQHVVLNRRAGRAIEVWENGLKIASINPEWDSDRHFRFDMIEIGRDPLERPAKTFYGELDEVCIFRRHLERDEIQMLYRVTKPPDGVASATPPPSSGGSSARTVRPPTADTPRPAPTVMASTRPDAPAPESPKPATPVVPPGLPTSLNGKLNQTILSMPDLLVYLPMAEGEGSRLFDAGPNQRHAQLFNTAWIDGRGGKVVRFNGRTSYARLPAGPPLEFDREGEFAVSVFFRSKTGRGPLFSFRGNEQDNRVWVSGMFDASRNLLGLVRSGTEIGFPPVARVFPIETKQYLDNAWHHVVLNRRPMVPTIELWVDGHLAASNQDNPKREGDFRPLFICLGMDWVFANGRPEGPPYFEGDMTEFCIFGRALPEEDILKLRGNK